MTPLEIIALRAPQWAADPRLSSSPSLIDLATQQTGNIFSDAQNDQTSLAVALRVLHWLASEAQKGGKPGAGGGVDSGLAISGPISSETEGNLSKAFGGGGVKAQRWPDLASTAYGCELIALIRSCGVFTRTRAMDSTGVEESVLPGFFSNTFGI
jgi:hypothetical protein